MEWYRGKMLPVGLPELTYQIAPAWLSKHLKIICYPRKKKGKMGSISNKSGRFEMQLYPTQILADCGSEGVRAFSYWKKFLKIILHEIGHVMTQDKWHNVSSWQYENDHDRHLYVEKLADTWMDEMLDRIAIRDPRLGQPLGWIGGLPGVYILKSSRFLHRVGDNYCREPLINYRAYKCGGQFSLTDLTDKILSPLGSPFTFEKRMKFGWTRLEWRIKKLIKKEAPRMGISRHYIDKAGRKHLFFNAGEVVALTDRVNLLMEKELGSIDEIIKEEERNKKIEELNNDVPF